MSNPVSLLVASSDEHFREMVRDSLLNIPNSKVVAEYQEVSGNLYVRVLQDLERHPSAGLVVDLSADPETAIKAVEKVKQAAPDLFVMVSNFSAEGEDINRSACVEQRINIILDACVGKIVGVGNHRNAHWTFQFHTNTLRHVSTESNKNKIRW